MPKVKSKKQAGLFGVIASGGTPRTDIKLPESKAREKLRGVKVGQLPERAAVYASRDEPIGDWARRQVEREMNEGLVDSLAQIVPQTPPVRPTEQVTFNMRDIAEQLDEARELGMTPTPEVLEALGRIADELEVMVHWLKEAT